MPGLRCPTCSAGVLTHPQSSERKMLTRPNSTEVLKTQQLLRQSLQISISRSLKPAAQRQRRTPLARGNCGDFLAHSLTAGSTNTELARQSTAPTPRNTVPATRCLRAGPTGRKHIQGRLTGGPPSAAEGTFTSHQHTQQISTPLLLRECLRNHYTEKGGNLQDMQF